MVREYAPQEQAREPEAPQTTGLFPELGKKETVIPEWAQKVTVNQLKSTRQVHNPTRFVGVTGQRQAKATLPPQRLRPDRLKVGLEPLAGYSIEQVRELHARSSSVRSTPAQTESGSKLVDNRSEWETSRITTQSVMDINALAVAKEGQTVQCGELRRKSISIQTEAPVQRSVWKYKDGQWHCIKRTEERPKHPTIAGEEGQLYNDEEEKNVTAQEYKAIDFSNAPPSPYTSYEQRVSAGQDPRLPADEPMTESDLDEETPEVSLNGFVKAVKELHELRRPPSQELSDNLKNLANSTSKELKEEGQLKKKTFYQIAAMHNKRRGIVPIRQNPIAYGAHRRVRKTVGQARNRYAPYRKKFNAMMLKATRDLMQLNGIEEQEVRNNLDHEQKQTFDMLLSNKFDLRPLAGDSRPPELEHKLNKGGPEGVPDKQTRSSNLVLLPGVRKGDAKPHPMMHAVKGGKGGDNQAFRRFNSHVAAAVSAGVYGHTGGSEIGDEDENSETT